MKQSILLLFIFLCIGSFFANAQFPPPAGQPGSTAIHKDSSIIVAWATNCIVTRGPQDISNPASTPASAGEDWMATGKAGTNGTVSFGDGGYAVLTFEHPIVNGQGWDFVIFENGFADGFLELGFVEVSSDGINFFRFPPTSLTQDTLQIGPFGTLDATKIDNLAGKYRVHYGTPFDLEELKDEAGLNVNNITHVKIIDVVGSILDTYATFDRYGNKINDPWPTDFPSSGFDLDAVGVINPLNASIKKDYANPVFKLYPNPCKSFVNIHLEDILISNFSISVTDLRGHILINIDNCTYTDFIRLDLSFLRKGIYFITLQSPQGTSTQKLILLSD